MTLEEMIKEDNNNRNKIAVGLASIRIARLKQLIDNYEEGYLTAEELLTLTDNLLNEEFKQTLGR
jgi:hypothetical protein